jgi:hypothetical protein
MASAVLSGFEEKTYAPIPAGKRQKSGCGAPHPVILPVIFLTGACEVAPVRSLRGMACQGVSLRHDELPSKDRGATTVVFVFRD